MNNLIVPIAVQVDNLWQIVGVFVKIDLVFVTHA